MRLENFCSSENGFILDQQTQQLILPKYLENSNNFNIIRQFPIPLKEYKPTPAPSGYTHFIQNVIPPQYEFKKKDDMNKNSCITKLDFLLEEKEKHL